MSTTTPTRAELMEAYRVMVDETARRFQVFKRAKREAISCKDSDYETFWNNEVETARTDYWTAVNQRNELAAMLWPTPEHEINDPTEY